MRGNVEGVIAACWAARGVRVDELDRTMFTVHGEYGDVARSANADQHTQNHACPELPHLFAHYWPEYHEAKHTCGADALWLS